MASRGLREGVCRIHVRIGGLRNVSSLIALERHLLRCGRSLPSDATEDWKQFEAIRAKTMEGMDLEGVEESAVAAGVTAGRPFWLSWLLLDESFQSEEFVLTSDAAFSPLEKTSELRFVSRPHADGNLLPKEILSVFPLQIFLCTTNVVRAVAVADPIDLSRLTSENMNDNKSDGGALQFPVKYESWVPLAFLDGDGVSVNLPHVPPASVMVSISVERMDVEESEKESEEESEEKSEEEIKIEMPDNSVVAPPPPPPPLDMSMEEEDPEHQLRHYRVSIDLRTIRGLQRPTYAMLQFTYPHLGATSVIRTPPQWHQVHSETRIEKGVVTYECATTRARLREILVNHAVTIAVIQRSPMGNTTLGHAYLNLLAALEAPPHFLKCPLTEKTFKTMEDYTRHREILQRQFAHGDIQQVPSRHPEVIYAADLLVPLEPVAVDGSAGEGADSRSALYGAKLRAVIIIEDKGAVGREMAVNVKPGYKMHNGALYDAQPSSPAPSFPQNLPSDANPATNAVVRDAQETVDGLFLDWERWRQHTEAEWREALAAREVALRKHIQNENATVLASKMDDLRRAQLGAAKLEVKLRTNLEEVARQHQALAYKEEQLELRAAQRLQELQLLTRRVRAEAKQQIDTEKAIADDLRRQIDSLQEALRIAEKRATSAETDYASLQATVRNSQETKLREELATVRAQLAEAREQNEREKALRSTVILEREYLRSQLHRVAMALKREREKNATMARQELEQLRLEFLAREERYILDGDREVLARIKGELANLRAASSADNMISATTLHTDPSVERSIGKALPMSTHSSSTVNPSPLESSIARDLDSLLASGYYTEDDVIVQQLRKQLAAN